MFLLNSPYDILQKLKHLSIYFLEYLFFQDVNAYLYSLISCTLYHKQYRFQFVQPLLYNVLQLVVSLQKYIFLYFLYVYRLLNYVNSERYRFFLGHHCQANPHINNVLLYVLLLQIYPFLSNFLVTLV